MYSPTSREGMTQRSRSVGRYRPTGSRSPTSADKCSDPSVSVSAGAIDSEIAVSSCPRYPWNLPRRIGCVGDGGNIDSHRRSRSRAGRVTHGVGKGCRAGGFVVGVKATFPAAFRETAPFCAFWTATMVLVSLASGSVSLARSVDAGIVSAVSSVPFTVSFKAVGA